MGVCLSCSCKNNYNINSSDEKSERAAAARVIWKSGEVREYSVAVTVEEVLSHHNSNINDYFVCNSDSLYFDQLIPALHSGHHLMPNHIYFILDSSQRDRPLSAADMAALALKATAGLDDNDSNKKKTKKKKTRQYSRVSPQQPYNNNNDEGEYLEYDSDRTIGKARGGGAAKTNKTEALPRSSSSSMRKLQRLTSRRAKLAVRSFRLRLSTIYEST